MAWARRSPTRRRSGWCSRWCVGKAVGVIGGTWGFARFTRAELDDDLAWTDVLGLSLLAGIGFTVSLLIGGLAYGPGAARDEHVKVAVLVGSVTAAALAAVVLRLRNRVYRQIALEEERDDDGDGVPDCFEHGAGGGRLPGRRAGARCRTTRTSDPA